ncbi:MAG: hypothetical protein CBE07_003305 [Pelagibacteraceae bacterium TMED247]|nr:MAG: hypothetical protein CBE07_003305 [Pelagibacteraceae bacterium TMED247]
MAVTSIYMGSLRYSMNGKKRKKHYANPTKRKPPIVTKQMQTSQAALDRIKESEEFNKKYPSMMEQAMKNGTYTSKSGGGTERKESPQYTGERKLVGIATMHKSNAVPIFESDKDHAKDIARMRR